MRLHRLVLFQVVISWPSRILNSIFLLAHEPCPSKLTPNKEINLTRILHNVFLYKVLVVTLLYSIDSLVCPGGDYTLYQGKYTSGVTLWNRIHKAIAFGNIKKGLSSRAEFLESALQYLHAAIVDLQLDFAFTRRQQLLLSELLKFDASKMVR